ncbi:MAG: hypothetical protein JKY48_16570 [Flavobacteriales bacterium]|nr:hypothetical protein [Flavobacteriales bacterium]
MDQEDTLYIIKMVAGIFTLLLGVVAVVTETKHKDSNKLTKWGYVAIIGLVVLSGFSITEGIIKRIQMHEAVKGAYQAEIEKQAEARIAALESAKRYDNNAKKQFQIIENTQRTLSKIESSIVNQDKLLKSGMEIGQLQKNSLNKQINLLTKQDSLASLQGQVYARIKESQFPLENLKLRMKVSYDIDPNFKNEILAICKQHYAKHHLDPNFFEEIDSLGIRYQLSTTSNNEKYIYKIEFDSDSPIILNKYLWKIYNQQSVVVNFRDKPMNRGYYHTDSVDFEMSFFAFNEEGGYKPINKVNKKGESRINVTLRLPPENNDPNVDSYQPKRDKTEIWFETSRVTTSSGQNMPFLTLYDLADKYVQVRFFGDGKALGTMEIEWMSIEVGKSYHRNIHFPSYKIEADFGELSEAGFYQFPSRHFTFLPAAALNLEPLDPFE